MSASKNFPEAVMRMVADTQTLLSFRPAEDNLLLPRAVLINPGDPVPAVFRPAYAALIDGAEGLPYTVVLPAYRGQLGSVNGRLICCLGADIHILEDAHGGVKSTRWPVEQISHVETGKVLLYSWLRLHGQTAGGAPGFTEFQFNTVTEYIIAPIANWVRGTETTPDAEKRPADHDTFDYLQPVNIKLSNYARRCVPPADPVIGHIYQPAIRVEAFSLLGLAVYRRRANPHMTILTGRELILIQDGALGRFGKNSIYAGIWHYIPLNKIASISTGATPDQLLEMSVRLASGAHVECLYTPGQAPELDRLISLFEGNTVRRIAAP